MLSCEAIHHNEGHVCLYSCQSCIIVAWQRSCKCNFIWEVGAASSRNAKANFDVNGCRRDAPGDGLPESAKCIVSESVFLHCAETNARCQLPGGGENSTLFSGKGQL